MKKIIKNLPMPSRQDLVRIFSFELFEKNDWNPITSIAQPIDYSQKVTIEMEEADKNLCIHEMPSIKWEDFGEYLASIYRKLQTKKCYKIGLEKVPYNELMFFAIYFRVDCDRHNYIGRLISFGEVIPGSSLYHIDFKEFGINVPGIPLSKVFSEESGREAKRIIHSAKVEENIPVFTVVNERPGCM